MQTIAPDPGRDCLLNAGINYGLTGKVDTYVASLFHHALTDVPAAPMPTAAARAIRPSTRAYSTVSAPSSSLTNRRMRLIELTPFLISFSNDALQLVRVILLLVVIVRAMPSHLLYSSGGASPYCSSVGRR